MTALSVAVLLAAGAWVWIDGPGVTARSWHPAGGRRLWSRGRSVLSREVSVAETLDLLALSLQGGAAVAPALRSVATGIGGRHGHELGTVAAALAWGVAEDRAWAEASPRWAPVRQALALAARAGVPPAGLLSAAARDLRRDQAASLEAGAARLSVRLTIPLGLAFLPAFLLTTVVPVVLALATDLLSGP